MAITKKNPQAASINQKQGPRVGNTGDTTKRGAFMKDKSKTGSERSQLADMVMSALANRGAGMADYVSDTVEGLHSDTGPKSNPTAGGTKYKITKKKTL